MVSVAELCSYKGAEYKTINDPEDGRMQEKADPDRGKVDPTPKRVEQIDHVPCHE
jgi:hypothetical protein